MSEISEMSIGGRTLARLTMGDAVVYEGGGRDYEAVEYIEAVSGSNLFHLCTPIGLKPRLEFDYICCLKSNLGVFSLNGYHIKASPFGLNWDVSLYCKYSADPSSSWTRSISEYSNPLGNRVTYRMNYGERVEVWVQLDGEWDKLIDIQFAEVDFSAFRDCTVSLFGVGYNSFGGRIGRMRQYDEDTLVGDYIPCIRTSDGLPGYLEANTRNFITNSGAGGIIATGAPTGKYY